MGEESLSLPLRRRWESCQQSSEDVDGYPELSSVLARKCMSENALPERSATTNAAARLWQGFNSPGSNTVFGKGTEEAQDTLRQLLACVHQLGAEEETPLGSTASLATTEAGAATAPATAATDADSLLQSLLGSFSLGDKGEEQRLHDKAPVSNLKTLYQYRDPLPQQPYNHQHYIPQQPKQQQQQQQKQKLPHYYHHPQHPQMPHYPQQHLANSNRPLAGPHSHWGYEGQVPLDMFTRLPPRDPAILRLYDRGTPPNYYEDGTPSTTATTGDLRQRAYYTDDRDRMVYVSWIPKKARAYNATDKRPMELDLKMRLREDMSLIGLIKVLLFPPKGVHCKLIFDSRVTAAQFMARYGGDNRSPETERWKSDLCHAFNIDMGDKFNNTVVKIEWSQK